MINSLEDLLREQQGKCRASTWRALHLYPGAVGLGDLARYREVEAESARRAGRVGPMDALGDEWQLVLGEPYARVRDLELCPAVRLPDGHRHLASIRRVRDGVVQEY